MGEFILPTVAVVRSDFGRTDLLEQGLRQALAHLGGMETFVRAGQRVLLKPDLMRDYPGGTGPTSDPEFVAAVGRLVAEHGARVMIGDSPFVLRGSLESFWKATGMAEIAARDGFELVNFERAGSRAVPIDTTVYYISRAVAEADVVINIPRLKADVWTGFAGGLRNMFGVIPGFQKGRLYKRGFNSKNLARTLVDVFSAVKPSLTIMEVSSTNGQNRPAVASDGFVVASSDAVALDTVVTEILGFNPDKMYTVRFGADAGLGIGWPEGIIIAGERLAQLRKTVRGSVRRRSLGFMPGMALNLVEPMIWMRSFVDGDVCDGCGACIEFCPTKALHFREGSDKPTINYNLCINCWAGLSNCPAKAISLRKSRIASKVFRA